MIKTGNAISIGIGTLVGTLISILLFVPNTTKPIVEDTTIKSKINTFCALSDSKVLKVDLNHNRYSVVCDNFSIWEFTVDEQNQTQSIKSG